MAEKIVVQITYIQVIEIEADNNEKAKTKALEYSKQIYGPHLNHRVNGQDAQLVSTEVEVLID
jgi:hypothetical protein